MHFPAACRVWVALGVCIVRLWVGREAQNCRGLVLSPARAQEAGSRAEKQEICLVKYPR